MSKWGLWAAEAETSSEYWAYLYRLSYDRAEAFLELLGEKASQVDSQAKLITMLNEETARVRRENAELSEQLEAAENQLEALESQQWAS